MVMKTREDMCPRRLCFGLQRGSPAAVAAVHVRGRGPVARYNGHWESIGLSGAYEDSPARYGGHASTKVLYSFPVIISRWKICFKHLLWLQ